MAPHAAAITLLPRFWKAAVGAVALSAALGACLLSVGAAAVSKLPTAPPMIDTALSSAETTAVISYAHSQIGQPYLWGGEGIGGFDCSGLVQAAYAAADIALPRVAQDQFDLGPLLDINQKLQPGDLVFFGSSISDITHVGIAIGNNEMIDAPHAGATVRIENYRWKNYVGATRPGGQGVTDASP